MISKKLSTILLFCLITFHSISQEISSNQRANQKFTLSGIVSDTNSNETLIGVNIWIPELKTGVTTNEYGFYSITIPKGNYTLRITYLGYQTIEKTINLDKSIKNNFRLTGNETQLQEVVIIENGKKATIRKPEMSVNKLSISTIKKCLLFWEK